jgi:iron-sulfur cluster repair protein YtfE (RIC family)
MNQDPIEELLQEHKIIMAQIADLRTAVADLAQRGEEALADTLPVFSRIGRMTATQLDLHRRKEDDVLFPLLEAVIGEGENTLTGVMRQEHRDIHQQGALLRETLHELNQVQHPAIEAEAARLQELMAGDSSLSDRNRAEALRRTGEEIIALLDMHFEKEEQVLFPMTRELLTAETLARVGRQFQEMS